jgi:hypothetical protein
METQEKKDEVSLETIEQWYDITLKLDELKGQEIALRTTLAKHYFPNATEGTNTRIDVMPNQWLLKLQRKINRTVDEALLRIFSAPTAGKNQTPFEEQEIDITKLVKWKPEVVISEYRKLSDEQRKFFDQVLVIKDGTPSLEVAKPSSRTPKNVYA